MMTVHAPFGVLLGGVFLLAAGGKLFRFARFRDALSGYRIARPRGVVALAVPAAELVLGGKELPSELVGGGFLIFDRRERR